MRVVAWILAAAVMWWSGIASAQDVAKIGIIGPFSGPFALYGQMFQRGAELYLDEIGGKAGNTKIELLYRDEGAGPERVKQLAQELIVRDKVKMLGGFVFTPSALAVVPLVNEAKIPVALFNAATGSLTRRSPYIVRVSHTQWQGAYTIAEWAARNGIKRAYVIVADYAPGHDAREGFKAGFTKAGGTVVGEVLYPTSTTDFAPYLQRIKDAKPEAIYVFTPVGPPSVAFVKTYASLGLGQDGIKLLGTGDTDEQDLPAMGNAALGVTTAYHYSPVLENERNKRFVESYRKKYGADQDPNFATVAAYVGMNAMADVVAKLGTAIDGDKAMTILKGWQADSPKGPVRIDPVEGDIVQHIYIRRVEKVGDKLGNVAFETIPNVGDPWKTFNPK
jgi:branched-chain amino acid transport system substrate-binding protein